MKYKPYYSKKCICYSIIWIPILCFPYTYIYMYIIDFQSGFKYTYSCKKGLMKIFLTGKSLQFLLSLMWYKFLYSNSFFISQSTNSVIHLKYYCIFTQVIFWDSYLQFRNALSKTGLWNISPSEYGPYYSLFLLSFYIF